MRLYIKAPSLSDSLHSITFNGNSLPDLKHAIKEALKPAFQALPFTNLSLRVGSLVIGEEILVDRELMEVLEEVQVSLRNPILVLPLMPYVDICIYVLLLHLGPLLARIACMGMAMVTGMHEAQGDFPWGFLFLIFFLFALSRGAWSAFRNSDIILDLFIPVYILLFLFRLSPPRIAWFYVFLAGFLFQCLCLWVRFEWVNPWSRDG